MAGGSHTVGYIYVANSIDRSLGQCSFHTIIFSAGVRTVVTSWQAVRRFRPSHPLDALVLTSLIWFLAKFVRYVFPPLFGELGATYDVSTAVLGTSFTGFMLAYAAMQFPSGAFADRFGSVPVLAGGALIAAVASLALVVDSPFAVLVLAMVVMGASTGLPKTAAVRLLSRIYPSTTGRAIGVLDTVGAFSGVVAPAAVVFALGVPWLFSANWRLVFLVAGIAGVAVTIAFVVRVSSRVPDDSGSDEGDRVDPRRYLLLFRRPSFAAFVLVTIFFSFTYNGVVAFLPLYLVCEAGLTSSTAGLLYSSLFVASLIQLFTGEISDRIGRLPVACVTLGLAAASIVALIALSGTGNVVGLGAAVFAIGLGSHGFRPVRGSHLMAVLPDEAAGGSLGVVRTLLMGSAAISPAIVGLMSDTVGFQPAFWTLAGTMAAATVTTAVLVLADR